jgi:flagellin
LNKSISNTRRASQIISTADSALGQVSNLLNDIRGLVVEAANSGALSPDEIAANQLQVDSSLEAINRIAQTTTFQGRKLLDGSLDFITTPGTNSTRIENLRINSASLGRAGQVDISINVSSAATQAELQFSDFTVPPPAVAATGAIELVSVTTPGVQATSGTITLDDSGGEFSITARAGGALAGALSNGFAVIIATDGAASSIDIDTDAETVTVTLQEGETLDDIAIALAGNEDFEFVSVTSQTVTVGDAATADGALADGVDEVSQTATINITAVEGGAQFNGTVNVVQVADTTTPTATFEDGALTVTINNTGDVTVASVVAAIEAAGDFTAEADGALTTFDAAAGLTINETDLTGGTDVGGAAVAASGTIDFEVETTPAVQATSGTITLDDSGGEFSITARAGGALAGALANGFAVVIATDGAASSIDIDTDAETVTVTLQEGETLDDIAIALAGNEDFEFVSVTSQTVTVGDAATADGALADGAAAVTSTGSIEVTASEAGTAFNGTINFVQAGGTTTPTATFANDTLTVTVNDTGDITLESIADAINSLAQFSATASGDLTQFAGDAESLNVTDTELTGGAEAETFGVVANAVFELAGSKGSEVFNVTAGTSLDQLVSQINLVSDATGVSAAADGTDLVLTSTGYGSKSRVELRVLSQGAGGNFGVGGRELGTDIVATVNGRSARGDGNQLSVNTATLNMVVDMEAGFEGNSTFTIVGGGANFQLGPEVVSNQQARIGIGSVNSARLGGVAGKLFELGSGEAAALATDPTRAAEIVNEAIAQVTSLRGRLGAFQATSLDSNLVSLNETVANLQEAESSIRDADFAAESAALTRAQILVQSGTNVLSLANQNPQNVLSLLR